MRRSACLTSVALLALAAAPFLFPPSARADALVNGSRRTEMLDCLGASALVNGDNNRLVFHGNCRSLHITGGGNVVEVELAPGGDVSVMGNANRVLYTPSDPTPSVAAQGRDNQIGAGSPGEAHATLSPALPDSVLTPATLDPALSAPTATVVLDGEEQNRDIDCAGRNVLIHGSYGRFTLRGGCRSISVQGRANTIQAELQPGAPVSISGDAVTLNYTLTMDGPPPQVSVTGANSQATHYTRSSSTTTIGSPTQ
jgi:hypothetical protein